jgi:hypothetical protein
MLAYREMKRSLAALAILIASPAAPAAAPGAFSVTIAAKELHEECVHLAKGEKRNYSWRSDGPVDFNIHYHRGGKASYPVRRDAMRGDGGTFVANAADDYCWMWTALDKPVKLEGRIAK